MTSDEDEEESKPEKIHWITQINKILPDNNERYGIEMKTNKTLPLKPAFRSASCRITQHYSK